MLKLQKEIDSGFDDLMQFVINKTGTYLLVYADKTVECKGLGMWESDNDLELDDPNYEEFNQLGFKISEHTGVTVDYHSLPEEIYYEGKLVFKKVDGKLRKVD